MPTPTTEAQLAAALAGRYDVEREFGRGGMATVYLARDPRHSRRVAIKVLDPDLAASLGAQRFLAEIRVTAALQHPNVLSLFDSGDANGLLYYVMPFVEGETLRQRLDRERQLPVRDALHIASGIAAALEHAHKAGVVHRDLKPENILLADGEPVVADFGIALAVRQAADERVTLTGLSLGTPAYMSPEQATGDRTIDGRSDIFALGCVTYEMLAGESPFAAPSAQAIIARIVTDTPRPLTVIRPSVPPHVAAAIDRALEKLPADRWASALEFSEALNGARNTASLTALGRSEVAGSVPASRRWLPWAVGGVAFAAGIAVAAGVAATRPSTPPRTTLRIPLLTVDSERFLPGASGIPFALSSDDRHVVYVGFGSAGASRIYVKDIEANTTRAVTGEGNLLQPIFSPDGQSIVYVDLAAERVVKLRTDGSLSTTLASNVGADNAGMSWVDPDTIVASVAGRLIALPTTGMPSRVLSSPDASRGEMAQWGPRVLNRRYVAYVATSSLGIAADRVAILDRQTGKTTITAHNSTTVLGAVDDHLLWVMSDGIVMAAPFDARTGAIGTATAVLEGVLVRPGGAAKAALSPRGSLVYQPGYAKSELMLVDKHGAMTPFVDGARAFDHPRWSPDGTRVAMTIERPGGSDVWVMDVRSKMMSRLTTTGRHDVSGWSPDGSRVVFRTAEPSTIDWQRADGSTPAEHLLGPEFNAIDGMISPDGKWIFYRVDAAHRSIYYTEFASNHTPHVLSAGNFDSLDPQLSPDGKWLAYSSDESGRLELYVRSFPNPGSRVQVSVNGGGEGMWSADGRSLYYRAGRAIVHATVSETPAFSVTSRTTLFENGLLPDVFHNNYDVSRDGERFLMTQSVNRDEETLMIYGWESELRKAWGGRK